MNKYPNVWRLSSLLSHVSEVAVGIDGGYAPARPVGFQTIGSRVRCAWLVFTGLADAVIWPEDEWGKAGSDARAALTHFAKGERHER